MKKITCIFLAAAILMIGIGVWRDEITVVINKGSNLCLECVGIG